MRSHLALGLACGAALLSSGCLILREEDQQAKDNRCLGCHGSAEATGDAVLKAAPPNDTRGNSAVEAPGVGAHQLHLRASATHGAIACVQCHVVPERTESAGHNDSDGPAELVFGSLASLDAGRPRYDANARRCSDVYCHGYAASNIWTLPKSSDQACGSCHGLPPSAPHPQTATCHVCHAEVIAADRTFLAPEKHVDGVLQLGEVACNSCHGSDAGAAPPVSLDGGSSRDQLGVGAHTTHLTGSPTARPVACTECHAVPQRLDSPGHTNGTVEVIFSGAALGQLDGGAAWTRSTATCTAWCHTLGAPDAGSPAWTSTGPSLDCNGCHSAPPAAPHPGWTRCSACHPNATGDGGMQLVDAGAHVNGLVEEATPANCDGCHGSTANPAPPRDLNGNTATTVRTVGAHQTHLRDGGAWFRTVECDDCHVVPAQTVAAGHANGAVEVTFSGPAIAGGAMPTWNGTTCANTTCHDPKALVNGNPTGGAHIVPVWTQVDGTQTTCRSCHELPPIAPHVQNPNCGQCHQNYDAGTFTRPDLHVNGQVTFSVP
ncbi:MAG: hypothetical protein IT380_06975 [Myxococcales bacterium]|nr:hypothetical protein [Myxococcales bacterium]